MTEVQMVAFREQRTPISEEQKLVIISGFLGGSKVFRKGHSPKTYLEAHEALVQGLPGLSVGYLIARLEHLEWSAIGKAIGMSLRTYHRLKSERKLLSHDQSSRAWKFAEVLAKATLVFGSQQKAEQWLGEPAKGLDGHRPVELLATQTGTELVEQFLERLDYGVYV
jgi:putative toxin-antitoxin system antitoxin component (TIGR02293 family)